jgi:PKHD-type hydroxylase
VRPVTCGARICAFFWIQSMVRSDAQRALLLDLDMSVQAVSRDLPEHESLIPLTGVYHNLLRQWAEV